MHGIYVHCYAHRLNLALRSALEKVEPLRNVLGILQSLNNFLASSPKRLAVLKNVQKNSDRISLTLKSLSATRWSCDWEAVKSVTEQLNDICKALLVLSDSQDSDTYSASHGLLTAMCNFDFVLGLIVLKVILSNIAALSRFLQGKTMDVITARRNAELTIATLLQIRTEKSFDALWSTAEKLSDQLRVTARNSKITFREAKVQRKKPSRRLQALVGEVININTVNQTPHEHHRISTYYASLDIVLTEMKSRFERNDQEVLCALGDIVLIEHP
jgi:hypothetical protein